MSQIHAAMTPSLLRNRIVSAYSTWGSSRAVQDTSVVPDAPFLRGILAGQNARFEELDDRRRIPRIEVAWMEACQNTAQLKTGVFVRGIPCDFSGWVVGSNKQELLVDNRIYETFDIPVEIFDNMFTPQEMFNIGLNRAVKSIAEKLNGHMLANAIQWAGVNKYTAAFGVDKGVGVGNAWKKTGIPWLNTYQQSLNSYLNRVQKANRLVNPQLFEGGVLSVSEYVDGSLDRFQFGPRQVVSDTGAFAQQSYENHLLFIARGSMAVFTLNNQTAEARELEPNYLARSIPFGDFTDANGKRMQLDMYIKRKRREMDSVDFQGLNTDNRCEYVDSYYLELNFKGVLNPLACNDKTTGIIDIISDNTLQPYLSPAEIARTVQYPVPA